MATASLVSGSSFMKRGCMAWWLILLFGLPLAANSSGLPVNDVAVLVDAGGTETLSSIISADSAGRFLPLAEGLNAGFTRDVHWLRFTIQVPAAGQWLLEIQPPVIDDIRLFEPLLSSAGEIQGFRERRGGDMQPFAEREIRYRAFVAKLDIRDTRPHVFYLRVQTSSISAAFLRLWKADDFQQMVALEYAVLGAFYGLMIAVSIINLLHWFWLRDALYIYFSLHVLALTLLYLGVNGFAGQFLFQQLPEAANIWLGLFLFLSLSASAPFLMRMLRVGRQQRGLFLMYRLQLVLPLLLLPLLFLGYFTEAARFLMSMMIVVICVSLWPAYTIWREGGRDGMLLLASIGVTLAGIVAVILSRLGFFHGQLWALDSRQVTVFISVMAMHVAVASRIRETESSHRAALVRIEQVTRARHEHRQFIAMLTHELRTPLAVIDSAVQSLEYLHQPESEESQLRYQRIRRSVARINGLVEQFLVNDRIDDTRLIVHAVPLDGAEIAKRVLQSCIDGSLDRVLLHSPHSVPCRGDAALIRVALINLLDNALKYSPSDQEVEFRVEAMERQGRSGVAWTVSDHGRGVAEKERGSVFEKYVRGADYGHVAGTGLGLYLAQRIAELHGGQVEILDRDGWGGVFRLWLPCEEREICST